MLARHNELLATLIFLLDGILIASAWMTAYWMRFHAFGFPTPFGVPAVGQYLWMGAVLTPVGLLVLRSLQVYRSGRTARLLAELFTVVQGVAILTALAGLVSFFVRGELSRFSLLLFAVLAVVGLSLSRMVIRMVLRELRRRGRNLRRVLIVGTHGPAERLIEKIDAHPHFGFDVKGLVAAGPEHAATSAAPESAQSFALPELPVQAAARAGVQASRGPGSRPVAVETPISSAAVETARAAAGAGAGGGAPAREPFAELRSAARLTANVPVLGTVAELPRLVEETKCEIVYLALLRNEHRAEEEALARLHDSTAAVRLVPDLARAFTLNASVEDFDGMPVVLVTESPGQGWAGVIKRTFDLALSSIGLVALSPMLLAIAVWVRLDSGGPVLYRQERVGLSGRRFPMIKFRTMRTDAELDDAPGWTKPGDPRRTHAGEVLRRLSLDELPQLWNVLRGEMSLVGPRPERPVYVDRFRASIPRYMLRHHVKAGITGWAQVHGLRGDTPLDERIRYDLDYIRSWSLALDVKILLMTIARVFRDANAH